MARILSLICLMCGFFALPVYATLIVATSDKTPGALNDLYAIDPLTGVATLLLEDFGVAGMSPNITGDGIFFTVPVASGDAHTPEAGELFEFIPGAGPPVKLADLSYTVP